MYIAAFLDRYNEYVLRNKIDANIVHFMSPSIRIPLRGSCLPNSKSDILFSLDNDEIIDLMKLYVKPTDTPAWIKLLRSSVKFPKLKYVPSITKLQEFFLACSEYTQNFLEVVKFLDYADIDLLPDVYMI